MNRTPQPPPNLDHVAVLVVDLAAAVDLYARQLGLPVEAPEDIPEMKVRTAKVTLANTVLELVEPYEDEPSLRRFLDRRGPGLHHICLSVPDVEAATERLTARGLRPVYDAPRPGAGGTRVNFLRPAETGGVLIELAQPPEAPGPDGP